MTGALPQRVAVAACVTRRYLLADGTELDSYFDEFALAADPVLLADVAAGLAALVPSGTQVLAGLALGGVPLVVALSAATGLPAAFVRAQPKRYGSCRQIEGHPVSDARVVMVDDVVRSGAQSVAMSSVLRAAGAKVQAAVCVLRRPSLGGRRLEAAGVQLYSLFEEADLMAVSEAGAR